MFFLAWWNKLEKAELNFFKLSEPGLICQEKGSGTATMNCFYWQKNDVKWFPL